MNGVEVASTPSTTPPGISMQPLTFGGPEYFFPGKIDDIYLYDCAMSGSQVAASYVP